MITTLLIDAYEERDVGIFDVPGAYLYACLPDDKHIVMVLRDDFDGIMCNVNLEYNKHIITLKNRKRVLYLKVQRAIYGCIESALCWYNLYSDTLKNEGFTINPYDECVANKIIDGKQCTITWYVDDNKISHVDSKVVDTVLDIIETHFGKLVITRGKTFNFLEMKINITKEKMI